MPNILARFLFEPLCTILTKINIRKICRISIDIRLIIRNKKPLKILVYTLTSRG